MELSELVGGRLEQDPNAGFQNSAELFIIKTKQREKRSTIKLHGLYQILTKTEENPGIGNKKGKY